MSSLYLVSNTLAGIVHYARYWDTPSSQSKSLAGKFSPCKAIYLSWCIVLGLVERGNWGLRAGFLRLHCPTESNSLRPVFQLLYLCNEEGWVGWFLKPCPVYFSVPIVAASWGRERRRFAADQVATWGTEQNITSSHTTGPWLSLCTAGPRLALSHGVRDPKCSLEPEPPHTHPYISFLLYMPLRPPHFTVCSQWGASPGGPVLQIFECSYIFKSFFLFLTIAPCPHSAIGLNLVNYSPWWCYQLTVAHKGQERQNALLKYPTKCLPLHLPPSQLILIPGVWQ